MKNSLTAVGVNKQHLISSATAALLGAGTINAMALKKKEISKEEAVKEVIKRTTQGVIATASVIAATNCKKQKNGLLKTLSILSIGAAGIYAVELLDKKSKKLN